MFVYLYIYCGCVWMLVIWNDFLFVFLFFFVVVGTDGGGWLHDEHIKQASLWLVCICDAEHRVRTSRLRRRTLCRVTFPACLCLSQPAKENFSFLYFSHIYYIFILHLFYFLFLLYFYFTFVLLSKFNVFFYYSLSGFKNLITSRNGSIKI